MPYAVGIDANTMCIQRCVDKQKKREAALGCPLDVEWATCDVTSLTRQAMVPAHKDPRRLVVYAYLGKAHLTALRPLLIKLIRAGARVVTYDTHLTVGPDVRVRWMYGDMLAIYSLKVLDMS